uniref:ciliogenesis and planar polarity effector 1 n=1 Tax=Myxine glutinosa TaxID=7769 RepID=UPI00358F770E
MALHQSSWLVGLLTDGELFLWHKDSDCLKSIPAESCVQDLISTDCSGDPTLILCVADDARHILLWNSLGHLLLWELEDSRPLLTLAAQSPHGSWSCFEPDLGHTRPVMENVETASDAAFFIHEVLGDCGLCSFVFNVGSILTITSLLLRWGNGIRYNSSNNGFWKHWSTLRQPLCQLTPACIPMTTIGSYVTRISPDGLVLAVAVNQRNPQATQLLFVSLLRGVAVSSHLRGCGCKLLSPPSKFITSYWVGDVAWSCDGVILACMLRRGALLLLSRLGEPLTLTTHGCSVEFGPAEFLPLHPLVTFSGDGAIEESSLKFESEGIGCEALRQRFSVSWHPQKPILIASDGFSLTILRLGPELQPRGLITNVLSEACDCLLNLESQLGVKVHREFPNNSLFDMKSYTPTVFPSCHWQSFEDTLVNGDVPDGEESSDDERDFPAQPESELQPFVGLQSGRLEFATMHDALFGQHHTGLGYNTLVGLLARAETNLLIGWGMLLSLRNVPDRKSYLEFAARCLAWLFSLVQNPSLSSSFVQWASFKKRHHKPTKKHRSYRSLLLFRRSFLALRWAPMPIEALPSICHLTLSCVVTLLSKPRQKEKYGYDTQSLLASFGLLSFVEREINDSSSYRLLGQWAFGSQTKSDSRGFRMVPTSDGPDCFIVPLVHHDEGEDVNVREFFQMPPDPTDSKQNDSSCRLLACWLLLSQETARFMRSLHCKDHHRWNVAHAVQAAVQNRLQNAGRSIGPSRPLKRCKGEQLFLRGLHTEALKIWQRELAHDLEKASRKSPVQQTRSLLAILFALLHRQQLLPALALTTGVSSSALETFSEDGLLPNVHVCKEAALAVVCSLGRFMAAYFSNRLLCVPPAHHVAILPSLLTKPEEDRRWLLMRGDDVRHAVRNQRLSKLWTPELCLDLLLLAGRPIEACWLALELGDWRTGAILGAACHIRSQSPSCSIAGWPALPADLHPMSLLLARLKLLLQIQDLPQFETKTISSPVLARSPRADNDDSSSEGLLIALSEPLYVAATLGLDILTPTLLTILTSAKDLASQLSIFVPLEIYLPAPPLYCPQFLADLKSGDHGTYADEMRVRRILSPVLQRILTLLRAAHCALPAACSYVHKLVHIHHILGEARRIEGLSLLEPPPASLLAYAETSHDGFDYDGDPCKPERQAADTLRELCALCWMLHVRDSLNETVRKHQSAKDGERQDTQKCSEHEVVVLGTEAMMWLYRMRPFGLFLGSEEKLHDSVLSLAMDLPPTAQAVGVLAEALPEPSEISIRLQDKYNAVYNRLNSLQVFGQELSLAQAVKEAKQTRAQWHDHLCKLIGPTQQPVWKPDVDEDHPTLTAFSVPLWSDSAESDHAEEGNLAEIDQVSYAKTMLQIRGDVLPLEISQEKFTTNQTEKQRCLKGNNHNIGSWQFELGDVEYFRFLDLFLGYLLERELPVSGQIVCEDPLMSSQSKHLQEAAMRQASKSKMSNNSGINQNANTFMVTGLRPILLQIWNDLKGQGGVNMDNIIANKVEVDIPLDRQDQTVRVAGFQQWDSKVLFKVNGCRKKKDTLQDGLFEMKRRTQPSFNKDSAGKLLAFPESLFLKFLDSFAKPTRKKVSGLQELKLGSSGRLITWLVQWANGRGLMNDCSLSTRGSQKCKKNGTVMRIKTSAQSIICGLWLQPGGSYDRLTQQAARCNGELLHLTEPEPVHLQVGRQADETSDTDSDSSGLNMKELDAPIRRCRKIQAEFVDRLITDNPEDIDSHGELMEDHNEIEKEDFQNVFDEEEKERDKWMQVASTKMDNDLGFKPGQTPCGKHHSKSWNCEKQKAQHIFQQSERCRNKEPAERIMTENCGKDRVEDRITQLKGMNKSMRKGDDMENQLLPETRRRLFNGTVKETASNETEIVPSGKSGENNLMEDGGSGETGSTIRCKLESELCRCAQIQASYSSVPACVSHPVPPITSTPFGNMATKQACKDEGLPLPECNRPQVPRAQELEPWQTQNYSTLVHPAGPPSYLLSQTLSSAQHRTQLFDSQSQKAKPSSQPIDAWGNAISGIASTDGTKQDSFAELSSPRTMAKSKQNAHGYHSGTCAVIVDQRLPQSSSGESFASLLWQKGPPPPPVLLQPTVTCGPSRAWGTFANKNDRPLLRLNKTAWLPNKEMKHSVMSRSFFQAGSPSYINVASNYSKSSHEPALQSLSLPAHPRCASSDIGSNIKMTQGGLSPGLMHLRGLYPRLMKV